MILFRSFTVQAGGFQLDGIAFFYLVENLGNLLHTVGGR